mmetsp:Transcript_21548/g.85684  ORF Transcript_21548/g.85684 Transcript_21548/m.85684 type:complete len:224 (+) Transcript_21548:567-1238(+)
MRGDGRHHCRRCGNTFCARCSSKRAPLVLYGLPTEQRVCDECASKAPFENELAATHLPLLTRGGTFAVRSATVLGALTGERDMALVKLNAPGDALVVLDKRSPSEDRPRVAVRLQDVASVDEAEPAAIVIRAQGSGSSSSSKALRLEAVTAHERRAFAAALRAAAHHAAAPDLAETIDRERKQTKIDKLRQMAIKDHRDRANARRQSNEDLRTNLRTKYNLAT